MDGLAAGCTVFALVPYMLFAINGGQTSIAVFTASLLGALIGFLHYNVSPAKIFMGDTGALALGAVLAALDSPLAFGCIGLAGVVGQLQRKHGWNELISWLAAVLMVGLGRFVCHVLSGVVFFAEYAAGSGLSPMVYSLSYNSFVFVAWWWSPSRRCVRRWAA